jgi:hypothetical protein
MGGLSRKPRTEFRSFAIGTRAAHWKTHRNARTPVHEEGRVGHSTSTCESGKEETFIAD